jgi:hypothetical protein
MRLLDLEPRQLDLCKGFLRRVARDVYPPPRFRVTLFGPTREGFIGPALRLEAPSEEPAVVVGSTVEFGSEDPIAGLAWAKPGLPFCLVLPETPGVAFFVNDLRLPKDLATHLAESPRVRQTKQVLCFGIPAPIPMVLSVDAFDKDGLGFATDQTGQRFQLSMAQELYKTVKGFADVVQHEWGQPTTEPIHA